MFILYMLIYRDEHHLCVILMNSLHDYFFDIFIRFLVCSIGI